MNLATHVTATEIEVIRLYEVALPAIEAQGFSAADVSAALSVIDLDSEYIDIFELDTLDELGLRGYMIDGLGIPESALVPYQERISAISGYVVVVLSRAFNGHESTLKNGHPLRLIGAFREDTADPNGVDLSSVAATEKTPKPAKKQKSQAAQSGMVATFVLLFMFLFVAVIIWSA
ncbi:MAG: hypothetical protein ABJ327_22055 [Litoreibacter sp.]